MMTAPSAFAKPPSAGDKTSCFYMRNMTTFAWGHEGASSS